ncbi:FAD-dependent oxidoreductase [Carnobacterium divergens]|uniref:FAD-dependent oxidoreductase n=2 Tax=Carnobacterium TaxID=2747 RepID=UPI00288E36AA|nr:FAD-dependent oxidoreductase [Carnobacterium divergens]MDT1938577.1 FAD-dependent oxidoreductase [Carnobacterium divergens]MDT1941015.1 FAD-dependent oxidoreductase [Carnobacterium divergens]MDT1946813.1 FAD-dependent oxidoreductase [Carnobacterium divergens]MDT1949250.1 FAD-dependent oxidoreductase [Carnobacterium divergens]MDT1954428.1 FAD-dependent oxidoreductase [Carnobacterium divergens]
MKVVVVGCTHAGTAAVKTILNEQPDASVSVFERNDNVSFLSCGIALYVGGVVKDPAGLFYSSPEELASMGAEINMEHNVKNIDNENKVVLIENLKTGETFEETYDKLVMTTGSWPIIPPIDGINSENILLCKNYNQANEIIKESKNAEKIVIVGGGYIGIELVEAFAESGKQVTLVDGLDRILNKYLDAEFTSVLEHDLQERGVTLALNQTVEKFVSNESGVVTAVKTPVGDYEADLVILCVGFKPNTDLLKGKIEMLPNGAIVVDEYMRTSDEAIFAAGDSCAVHYNPTGGSAYIPLATNAVRMGALVGKNIVSPTVQYRGTQATSGLYLFGFNIGSTGLTENSAPHFGVEVRSVVVEDNYRPEFMPTTEKVTMKLVYEVGTNRIVGGQIMSKYDVTQSANTLSLCVQNKMTIEDLAYVDFFFQPHFDRPWNYLNILAQAAVEQERKLAK